MSTNRRDFLKLSALAGGSVGLGLIPGASNLFATGRAVKPLRILVLGGTGFTGPFQVQYALSRGHKVTVFNRGKTHPGELPKEAEQLIGDRNGKLDALKVLLGRGAKVNVTESLRGTNALMWAAEQGHADVVRFLLDNGADVQAQSSVIRPMAR